MTLNELRRRYPIASASFIRRNLDVDAERLRPAVAEPAPGRTLDGDGSGEGASGHRIIGRITLRITVFCTRPADPDNRAGGIKFLLDQLRYFGLIKNDTPEDIRLEIEQVKVKTRSEHKTVIEIFDISNER